MSEAAAAPEPVTPAAAITSPTPSAEVGTPAVQPADSAAAPKGDEKTPATPDQAEKRGQSRFDRKIDRLHRRAAEAEARAQLFEKQLNELRPKAPEDPGAPKLEQFKDIEEYASAKAKFESDRTLKEHTAKQHSETQKQSQARLQESWEEKAGRAEGKYDDFDEVVGDLKPTSPWTAALMEAENAEDIAYYLGKNLKEAQRIASLPPMSQIREIGKLEAKFLAEPAKPKTPSKAPAPIAALTGTSPAVSDAPSPTDNDKEWFNKRLRAGRGRG